MTGDDTDEMRLAANLAALCDLAAVHGLRVDVEFMRWRVVGNLAQALGLVERARRPNCAVLLDALHLFRSGGTARDVAAVTRGVAAVTRGVIGGVQLSDAGPKAPQTIDETIQEARGGRLPPGDGVLPLAELLHSLPASAPISVEMPMPSLATDERLALAYGRATALIAGT